MVLLYAEIENFRSEQTAEGYYTALRGSYEIFDSRGQRVTEHEFNTTDECCQRARRDFFVVYSLRLPKRIWPGCSVVWHGDRDDDPTSRGRA